MLSNKPTRWAVLIGIDRYSTKDSRLNLNGCVADVQETISFLESNLGVLADNIATLTAGLGGVGDTQLQPTRTNVINTIQDVSRKANPGDFVYFHYSGHGDRVPTIYTDRKGASATLDEVICTLDEDIRDVELGDLFDLLADKGLLLCVVLDSCHSGGATRHRNESEKVRCRSKALSGGDPSENANNAAGLRGNMRNMSTIESWLNRPRKYNLIAACQPHEQAQELTPGSRTQGALTYHLLDSLRSFKASKKPVTYEDLHQILEPKFRALRHKQQPLHLGDKSRVVFGTAASSKASTGLLTSVAKLTPATVTFVDGSTSQVGIGDCFKIYRPPQLFLGLVLPNATPVAKVRITRVRSHESEAEVYDGDLKDVETGWLAKMSHRAQGAVVNIRQNGDQALVKAISSLEEYSRRSLDPLRDLDLRFEPDNHDFKPNFIVEISQDGYCLIFDRQEQRLPHLPLINISQRAGVTTLMHLLQHLSSYHMVAELNFSGRGSSPLFKFEVRQRTDESEDNDKYLSIWDWSFENKEKSQVLYIAVLNLGPAYGVHQLYPAQRVDTASVEPGESVSEGIGIDIPPLLKTASLQPGFRMRDTIKLLVTTTPTNFSHYEINDLTEDMLASGGRRAKSLALERAPWHVVEKYITTTI